MAGLQQSVVVPEAVVSFYNGVRKDVHMRARMCMGFQNKGWIRAQTQTPIFRECGTFQERREGEGAKGDGDLSA